jgi:hypothetical protein
LVTAIATAVPETCPPLAGAVMVTTVVGVGVAVGVLVAVFVGVAVLVAVGVGPLLFTVTVIEVVPSTEPLAEYPFAEI